MDNCRTLRNGVQSKLMATIGRDGVSLMTSQLYRAPADRAARGVRCLVCIAGLATVGLSVAPEGECGPPGPAVTSRVSRTRRLMGVPWRITVHAGSEADGETAIAAGFAEVARLERVLSDYDPDSELSRLSAASPTERPVAVGDDLWRVLERSVAIRDASGGGFDPTVGPLTTLWRQARRSGRLPVAAKLAAARGAVGPDTLQLVPAARAVLLTRPAMRLDLGGIGMGYAIDRALEVLGRHGIASAMIDASGDIAVSAAAPGTDGWRIAVAPLDPGGGGGAESSGTEPLRLCHAAVTTSGDARQGVEIDGRRYSHIVDPRTGLGVVGHAAVTVIARDCTTADALATAASVLGPERSAELIAGEPGCAARFVWLEAGQLRQFDTPRWPSLGCPDQR